ncbi:MAG: Fic family protein [Candidatus Pacebacteria bacterium]|nr:Fic family protein [Candidatus Paceibacterota bacterium]
MKMIQLDERSQKIIDFIAKNKIVGNKEVLSYLIENGEDISRITLIRSINSLIDSNFIEKIGFGRSLKYRLSVKNDILTPINFSEYLSKEQDERSVNPIHFNFDVFSKLESLFSEQETQDLEKLNSLYQKRISSLSDTLIAKEIERITIELSWKSSKIEGNTYSLLDTEMLIKDQKEALGHKKEEAVMILNHKKALDYIFQNKNEFKEVSLSKIENLHSILVGDLNINKGVRSKGVGITGTNYRPLDNQFKIKEVLEKTVEEINKVEDAWSKALISIMMIAYIQPFEDGNKRTSRILANACLISHNICPLSLRNIDETEYKKAITVFYELQNATLIKKLFIEQFNFSINNYFI